MENEKAGLDALNARKPKLIFADPNLGRFGGLTNSLHKANVETESATDLVRLVQRLKEEKFDLCVVNLLLGNSPFELINEIKSQSSNPEIKLIIVTRQIHKMNIQDTIRAGADDFIAEPFESLNLYNRILYHLKPVKMIERLGYEKALPGPGSEEYIKLLLDSVEILSRTRRQDSHHAFFKIVQSIASLLSSNRTSLTIVDEGKNTGVVVASSDDEMFQNFPITLEKYPEILHVLHTGNLVVIEDVASNSMTERIKKEVRSIEIGSLMVFPVCYQDEVVGVLNVRRAKASELPTLNVMRILQATANLMAAHANVLALIRKIYRNYPTEAA
jgi:DNA-binding response OmpR family regulator